GRLNRVKKAAVTPKPFPKVHPMTGKPAKDTDMIMVNGQQVTIKTYYEQINNLEKQLNALGHSLRGGEAKIILARLRHNKDALNSQAKKAADEHKPFDPKTMFKPLERAEMVAAFAKKAGLDTARLANLDKIAPATSVRAPAKSLFSKSFDYKVGNPAKFEAFLNGRLELLGGDNSTSLTAEATAGGTLVNNRTEVVKVTGSLTSPRD